LKTLIKTIATNKAGITEKNKNNFVSDILHFPFVWSLNCYHNNNGIRAVVTS